MYFLAGNIARSRCGLKIGWGEFYESLSGCIDQVSGECVGSSRVRGHMHEGNAVGTKVIDGNNSLHFSLCKVCPSWTMGDN